MAQSDKDQGRRDALKGHVDPVRNIVSAVISGDYRDGVKEGARQVREMEKTAAEEEKDRAAEAAARDRIKKK